MRKHNTAGQARQADRVLPIRDASGRICAGVRLADLVLQKDIRAAHYLRRPPAVCWDECVLDEAERAGARACEVHDLDTGKTLTATIADVRARGFAVNRGFGRQVALALHLWRRDDEAAGEQLGLWSAPG